MQIQLREILDTLTLDELLDLLPQDDVEMLSVQQAAKSIGVRESVVRHWINTRMLEYSGTIEEPRIAKTSLNRAWKSEQQRRQEQSKAAKAREHQPQSSKRQPKSKTASSRNTLPRPDDWVSIKQAARMIGVSQAVIRSCATARLVPSIRSPQGALQVRVADFLTQEFRDKVARASKKPTTSKATPSSSLDGRPQRRVDAPSALPRYRDPDKLVVGAMVQKLKEIERAKVLTDADRQQRDFLRNEIKRRDPDTYDQLRIN